MSNKCASCAKKLSLAAAVSTAKCACEKVVCAGCMEKHQVECEAARRKAMAKTCAFGIKMMNSGAVAEKLQKV